MPIYSNRLLPFLLLLLYSITAAVAQTSTIKSDYSIDFEKIREEKNQINLTLDEIVTTIEESIETTKDVAIPEGVTEFERALFVARKIQHNRDELGAIKLFKTLLEFECYRTKGEELYIRLLLGTSIKYLGSPLIAHSYMNDVFPDIFNEIQNPVINGMLVDQYAGLLIQIDSIDQAISIYKNNLSRYQSINDSAGVYSTRNNLGFAYSLNSQYEEAKALFVKNQNDIYKKTNPVVHAFSFGNYGAVLVKEKKYAEALSYYQKEVSLLNAANSTAGVDNAYMGMGEIFEAFNQLDSANFYYELSLAMCKKNGNLKAIVKAYEKLIRFSALQEKSPRLSYFLDNYLTYGDSLKKALDLNAANQEIQVSRFLEIFSETEESKRRYDQLEAKNKDLIYATSALIFTVIALILVISYRYINRRKLKLSNLELEKKNIALEKSNQAISDSHNKNEILLKELHHRVKNNLQIISSLFNLQLNASQIDLTTEQVFRDARNRIYSISMAHKKIYQSDNIDSLDFGEYLRDFSSELLNATTNEVNLTVDILRNPISIESAIPLGLIFNELLTNSIKHAKPHDALQINITHSNFGEVEKFIYTDNGVGVQKTTVMEESDSSIGVTLIHLLAKQLDATLNYKEAEEGVNGFWLSIEGKFN